MTLVYKVFFVFLGSCLVSSRVLIGAPYLLSDPTDSGPIIARLVYDSEANEAELIVDLVEPLEFEYGVEVIANPSGDILRWHNPTTWKNSNVLVPLTLYNGSLSFDGLNSPPRSIYQAFDYVQGFEGNVKETLLSFYLISNKVLDWTITLPLASEVREFLPLGAKLVNPTINAGVVINLKVDALIPEGAWVQGAGTKIGALQIERGGILDFSESGGVFSVEKPIVNDGIFRVFNRFSPTYIDAPGMVGSGSFQVNGSLVLDPEFVFGADIDVSGSIDEIQAGDTGVWVNRDTISSLGSLWIGGFANLGVVEADVKLGLRSMKHVGKLSAPLIEVIGVHHFSNHDVSIDLDAAPGDVRFRSFKLIGSPTHRARLSVPNGVTGGILEAEFSDLTNVPVGGDSLISSCRIDSGSIGGQGGGVVLFEGENVLVGDIEILTSIASRTPGTRYSISSEGAELRGFGDIRDCFLYGPVSGEGLIRLSNVVSDSSVILPNGSFVGSDSLGEVVEVNYASSSSFKNRMVVHKKAENIIGNHLELGDKAEVVIREVFDVERISYHGAVCRFLYNQADEYFRSRDSIPSYHFEPKAGGSVSIELSFAGTNFDPSRKYIPLFKVSNWENIPIEVTLASGPGLSFSSIGVDRGLVFLGKLPEFVETVGVSEDSSVDGGWTGPLPIPLGDLAYHYHFGKFEVTNEQYASFLNAVGASDPYSLYNLSMGTDPRGGISRSGSEGSYRYQVRPFMADKPVNFVSFWDAARFANWLTNRKPFGNADESTTEDGMYFLGGEANPPRTSIRRMIDFGVGGAGVAVASEDEWVKAGYYDGEILGYWLFPTRTNLSPSGATCGTDGAIDVTSSNLANFGSSAKWNGLDGHVTTVGSAGSRSSNYFGTFDQGGNVREWTDTLNDSGQLILRGGSYSSSVDALRSDRRDFEDPSFESSEVGFRVTSSFPIINRYVSDVDEVWQFYHGVDLWNFHPKADRDGDGIPLALEAFLNTAPSVADRRNAPSCGIIVDQGQRFLLFKHRVLRGNNQEVGIEISSSLDDSDWNEWLAVEVSRTDVTDVNARPLILTDEVVLRSLAPFEGDSAAFLRLRAKNSDL